MERLWCSIFFRLLLLFYFDFQVLFFRLMSGNSPCGSNTTEVIGDVELYLKVHSLSRCQTSTGNFTSFDWPFSSLICSVTGKAICCKFSIVINAPFAALSSTYFTLFTD